ncbi:uncharacterized protein LOC127651977 [Xyrauchen texanus]|uniref:uncharacterized protein LOC127651977 n=1 Tax=Xyrauchen texanus TaxID=154827 RepID=UPI0022425F9F|nr:uncharacterized protein LOC127651977 [Xyrauchen texanus]
MSESDETRRAVSTRKKRTHDQTTNETFDELVQTLRGFSDQSDEKRKKIKGDLLNLKEKYVLNLPEEKKIFNDPIHGQIELHPLLVKIIDTRQFQRLRHIKQLGAKYLVFPGATHTRFEHSLGVAYLAGCLVKSLQEKQPELNITNRDSLCVQIAALCHDLGHGPFSHLFDGMFIPQARPGKCLSYLTDVSVRGYEWKHEEASIQMFQHMVDQNGLREVMGNYGLNPEEDLPFIEKLIQGVKTLDQKSFLYEIVANKRNGIDVDKWDYFVRDCHYLGIPNNFDLQRLLKSARVCEVEIGGKKEQSICFRDKVADTIYDMFYTRYTLHRRALQHKTGYIIDVMITEALIEADGKLRPECTISESIDDMAHYTEFTDGIFEEILNYSDPVRQKNMEQAQRILKKIVCRELPKFVGDARLKRELTEQLKEDLEKRLKEIKCGGNGLTAEDFGVYVVEMGFAAVGKSPIDHVYFYNKSDLNKSFKIEKMSTLIPEKIHEWLVRVYCKNTDQTVQQEAEKCFHDWCKNNRYIDCSKSEHSDPEPSETLQGKIKIFNDPIHGHIKLHPLLVKIIDTRQFQRLRHIKQLGGNYLVYPGATHTRFEHSLGMAHLARCLVEVLQENRNELSTEQKELSTEQEELSTEQEELSTEQEELSTEQEELSTEQEELSTEREELSTEQEELSTEQEELSTEQEELSTEQEELITPEESLCVQIAALCYNLGHGPFSYLFERFIGKVKNDDEMFKHEELAVKMLQHMIDDESNNLKAEMAKYRLNPDEHFSFIKNLIKGNDASVEERSQRLQDKPFLSEIVVNKKNGIDVRRWDYFARDCHYLGISNSFDHQRLLTSARLCECDDGKMHICFRDKVADDIHNMFLTRYTLYRQAYKHKICYIIEEKITEVLEAADEALRISTAVIRMEDYTKLTDHIFEKILYSKDENLKMARTKLLDIVERRLPKFVAEARLPETENQDKKALKKTLQDNWMTAIHNWKEVNSDSSLNAGDFLVHVVDLDYGMKGKNFKDNVYFYTKRNPMRATKIQPYQVSSILPDKFSQVLVRIYYEKSNNQGEAQAQDAAQAVAEAQAQDAAQAVAEAQAQDEAQAVDAAQEKEILKEAKKCFRQWSKVKFGLPPLIIFYEDESFQGEFYRSGKDCSDLRTSLQCCNSIRVEGGGTWVLYENPNFSGCKFVLTQGKYPTWKGPKNFGSCKIFFYKIELYKQENFAGEPHVTSVDCRSLPDRFSTSEVRSCKVLRGVWKLYKETDYEGEHYQLEEGEYPNHQEWGADCPTVRSLKLAQNSDQ